jgi:hypothetical protein
VLQHTDLHPQIVLRRNLSHMLDRPRSDIVVSNTRTIILWLQRKEQPAVDRLFGTTGPR